MFTNKVALITGASSGIGRAVANCFSENAASLFLTGRKANELEVTAQSCLTSNVDNIAFCVADLTKACDIDKLISKFNSKFSQLDCIVNCAGAIASGSIETTTIEQFDSIMNINIRSIFRLTKLLIDHLKRTKGCIINVSSVNGIRSFPGVLAYNVSKAAVDQFTRCAALELAPYGIRVNSVNPGVTVTNLHKRGGMNEKVYASFLEHSKSTHALGRPGNPIEVAQAVAFLASEQASFITGVNLPVDGGRHAMCPR